jgi:hypothetical protein
VSEQDLLHALVEAEHAAIYGYGVLGARLDPVARRAAVAAYDVHRARRDRVVAALEARGGTPPRPLAAYDVVVPDRAAALALAAHLEEGVALRWRALVGGTRDKELRQVAIAALQESAVRAAQWRKVAGVTPVTVPFPGT